MANIVEQREAAGEESGDKREVELQITLLGGFSLRQGNTAVILKTSSHQALLAYLIVHAGRPHSRQSLAFRLWQDSTEAQALTNLRKAIYTIRRTISGSHRFLEVTRGAVEWRLDSHCSVDVWEFETAVDQAQRSDSPTVRQQHLEQAINSYHGDFLAGHYDDWILAIRERLRRRYLDALEEQLSLAEINRQYKGAIRLARRLLREDPLHEAAYRRLMRLQSLDGDVAGALRTYHACSAQLHHELGVDPTPATREAYQRLMRVDVPQQSITPARLPLTGRKKAWQSLLSAWRQGSSRKGEFVLITGEAGIGKTRLVEELLDWAARQGISTLSASCYAAGGSLPYAPITTWLRAMTCRRCLENLPDNWLQEVSRLLPELLIDRPDLEPPGPISEGWQRQHLFAALAHALLSQTQPFVLFIDDLQWCDADTLQWLSYLMHFDETARFLLLGAARPEEIGDDHPLNDLIEELHRDDAVVEMELSRLNLSETQVLAGHVTGEALDAAQTAELAAYSEGVPLFIVEMARAGWADIAGAGGEQSADDLEQRLLLPAKVQAVVEARLSRLSPPAADLAALGAAIGHYFTYDLLSAASTQKEAVIVRALDELWQQRIVREQGADAYDFSHDQLRQVVYASLSSARKRWLHGRIVAALEAIRESGGEVDSTRLGEHYGAAGRPVKAAVCFRRAAVDAQQLYAHQEAMANLKRALALPLGDDQLILELYEQLADVQVIVGQYDEARESLAAAQTVASEPIDQARLLRKQGNAWISQRLYEQAGEAYDAALETLEREPDRRQSPRWWEEWVELQLNRGELLYYSARLPELAVLIDELREPLAEDYLNQKEITFLNLQVMYNIAAKRWRLDAGDVDRSARLLALTRQGGNEHQIAFVRFSLGFMHLFSGSPEEAEIELTGALKQAIDCANLPLQDQCLTYLMLAHRRQGNVERVRQLAERLHPISRQVNNFNYRGVLFGCEAWLSYKSGDMQGAVRHGETALEMWKHSPYPLAWAALWPLLAVALGEARTADAVEYAKSMVNPPAQRLADDVTAKLQCAVDAWEADETAVCVDHLKAALLIAEKTGTF